MIKRAKQIIPTFEEMYNLLPNEIKDCLDRCANTPQSSKWHPESPSDKVPHNVLNHTKIVYERAKNMKDFDLAIAAIFHDLGKVNTTRKNNNGNWTAHGHELESLKLVEKYKEWIEFIGRNFEKIKVIVKEHMRIKFINNMRLIKQEALRQNQWFNEINTFSQLDDMRTLTNDELNI